MVIIFCISAILVLIIIIPKLIKLQNQIICGNPNHKIEKSLLQRFTKEAIEVSKNNSPISDKPFNKLISQGNNLIERESFLINDNIILGSNYRVV